ncbi:MAG: DUF3500 domain-containing protein [Bacteroidota bacterium]|nr:hypothetical protein [Odoribacter sp.]MDP3645302.1 DUF3500 domain-containing protein [Bacteroidota bacterium]
MKLLLILLLPLSLFAKTTNNNNFGSARAMAFVNSLSEIQKKKAVFPFDEMNRYDWHYLPSTMAERSGIAVKDLNSAQKLILDSLLQSYLSEEGFQRTKEIMGLEYFLKETEPTNLNRIPENYFVSVYGIPGKDRTWAWKFSGHHISLNYTVVNNQMAFAPFFFGAHPAVVKEGSKKGMRIIHDEEDLGFLLVNSFTQEQKQTAIFQLKAFSDIVTTNAVQVSPLKHVGIFARDMTHAQKTVLNKLIVAYLLSMPKPIAKIRMEKIIKEDLNLMSFGWAGGTGPRDPHYYRVQGKTFLIEFDNTQNNANHIHSVWRDFNGDFGEDLLKEHYQLSHHHE